MSVVREAFGRLPDGQPVERIVLSDAQGMQASVLTLGATLQALLVPDRAGVPADVTLGHDDLDGYMRHRAYFGATAGRYANRIAKGRFTLDATTHTLAVNNGANHLHGGPDGFDRQPWDIESIDPGAAPAITLSLVSPDGAGGYPGSLSVTARYALDGKGGLSVRYRARSDRRTILNLTHHPYWNLSGAAAGGSALDHVLSIAADAFTPVDATLIPTGEIVPVADTPFDFRRPVPVGARIGDDHAPLGVAGGGYDHNYVVTDADGSLRQVAELADPASGRVMTLFATAPGLQFYSGGGLDGSIVGKGGRRYRSGDGLCLEPQAFPDSPNQPHFPSTVLEPGQTYHSDILYRFGAGG